MSEEIQGPKRLARAETVRSVWCFVVPEDTPYTDCFEVSFWRRACEQLKAGDRIEVVTADRLVQFEITILASNAQADPARLDMVFRPVFPPGLEVPSPLIAPSRWRLKQRQTDGAWLVFDSAAGEVVADGLRREDAQQRIALLEKLAREQDGANQVGKVDKITPGERGASEKGGDPTIPAGWLQPRRERVLCKLWNGEIRVQSKAELDRLQRRLNDLYSLDQGPARPAGGVPSPMAAPMPGADGGRPKLARGLPRRPMKRGR